jgi:DinB superfamily
MRSSGVLGAVELNRAAVAEFVAAALGLPPAKWMEPRAPGKWSPAQTAEHLAIVYELAEQIVNGTAKIPGRKPPRFLHPLIRFLIRTIVLRSGKFPKLKTPAAFEASPHPDNQRIVCVRLQRASAAFEQAAAEKERAGTFVVRHPYYGRFGLDEFVRLQAYHTRHHHAQLLRRDT